MTGKDVSFTEPPRRKRQPTRFSYLGRMLLDDEYVVHIAPLHWIIFIPSLFSTLFGLALERYGYLLAYYLLEPRAAALTELPMKGVAYACAGIGGLYLFFTLIRHISTELVVTNQRIIFKRGLIASKIFEASLPKISSVDIDYSFLGRFLDYGMVTVRASGADLPPVDHIADPQTFYFNTMHSARKETRPDLALKAEAAITGSKKLEAPSPHSLAAPPAAAMANHHDDNDDE